LTGSPVIVEEGCSRKRHPFSLVFHHFISDMLR